MRSSHALDRTEITFDDDHSVANAGLVLTATLAKRLGIEGEVNETVVLAAGRERLVPGAR